MYRKQDEINKLQRRAAVPYGIIDKKRKELYALEDKFAKQIAFERSQKGEQ